MVEIHLPHIEDDGEEEEAGKPVVEAPRAAPAATAPTPAPRSARRTYPYLKLALEVVLIAVGVFLGLAGEQWRENAHRRELATESLRRFRAEILTNRKAVAELRDYHVATKRVIEAYLAADPKQRHALDPQMRGIQPVFFEHTAWDLAIATQSLSDIDSGLAFALSRIYGVQQEYAELTRGVLQAMYLRPAAGELQPFFQSVAMYYGDVVLLEPKLLELYDALLPHIDRALGESRNRE